MFKDGENLCGARSSDDLYIVSTGESFHIHIVIEVFVNMKDTDCSVFMEPLHLRQYGQNPFWALGLTASSKSF